MMTERAIALAAAVAATKHVETILNHLRSFDPAKMLSANREHFDYYVKLTEELPLIADEVVLAIILLLAKAGWESKVVDPSPIQVTIRVTGIIIAS